MELSDVILRQISDNLGAEWEKLASFLGFSKPKIEQFTMDGEQRGIENSIFTMLVSWRERQPVKSTNFRKELRDALVKCGRSDLADTILEVSPRALLDLIYTSLCRKLETKPELFEEAVNLFYKSYVSMETDSQLVLAMAAFGHGTQGAKCAIDNEKTKEVEKIAVRKWRKSMTIKSRDGASDYFSSVTRMAIHPYGDIALIDKITAISGKSGPRVYVFNQLGSQKFVLYSIDDKHAGRAAAGELVNAFDIAVTNGGKYVIADGSTTVKVFSSVGQYLGGFTTLSEDASRGCSASARCITVNPSNGEVLVGDYHREVITVHDGGDFKIKQEVHVDLKPVHILSSKNHILVTMLMLERKEVQNKAGGKVVAFDYEGDSLFTIVPILSGEPARPIGVVCDSNGGIYITAMKFDVTSLRGKENSGHIHYYSIEGKFVKCVAKGLHWPMGMALKNDVLAVADDESAKIYSPDLMAGIGS